MVYGAPTFRAFRWQGAWVEVTTPAVTNMLTRTAYWYKFPMDVFDNQLLIFGTVSGQTGVSKSMLYNATSNAWTPGPSLDVARDRPAALTYRGSFYVCGGNGLKTVLRLNPGSRVWDTSVPDMPAGVFTSAFAVYQDRIHIMGGVISYDTTNGLVDSMYIFDGTRWSTGAKINGVRYVGTAVVFEGYLWLFHGATRRGVTSNMLTERYNGTKWTAYDTRPPFDAHSGSALTVTAQTASETTSSP
eukprot:m.289982 g.289982  ORF g.289982 m.289982 type:complete len:244 (-) comp17802_c1_seq4:5325-6056(-)